VLPGTLIDYSYRVRLAAGAALDPWLARLAARFPDAGWRVRKPGEAAPNLARLLDRVSLFMTLVGLTALLVGGVGVANAVRAYLATKIATIATLKSLGAPSGVIVATYLAQILIIAMLGIAAGLILGALIPIVAFRFVPDSVALPARLGLYPAPLALAALFGVLTTLAFSLWPIASACETPAAALFRAAVEPPSAPPPWLYRLATACALLLLAALGVWSANDRLVALGFLVGAAASLVLFRLLALGLMAAARRIHGGGASLRLALGNLHRPRSPAPAIVASLGLGLAVLVAIALIENNLARLVDEDLPERAPSFFFIDLQPDQKPDFDRLLAATPGVSEDEAMASLRGRIVKLKGVPADRAEVAPDARWTLQSERGLTYASRVPRGSRIVSGQWWSADYRGPPLVSMDSEIASGLGLTLGDNVTVDVLGHEMTATLASTRAIDWGSLGINFVMIFSPGALDGVPQTFIVTAHATPEAEPILERAVAERFPNVSAIPVRDVLAQLGEIVGAVAIALRATASVALLAGILVLAGAVAAGQRRRVYEAVLLKVLGATRGAVTRAFLIEFALLGLATAIVAIAVGTLAADYVVAGAMGARFEFAPLVAAATGLIGAIATVAIGYAGTWRALGARPAPYLANE
jgi:putative ABC transport system permease protein